MSNGLRRFLLIVIAGLVCEYVAFGVCYRRLLDVAASLLAAPFWPLALLWARFPSPLAVLISAPATFVAMTALYCHIDLSHDPQAGVALLGLASLIVVVSVVLFAFGLALRSPKK